MKWNIDAKEEKDILKQNYGYENKFILLYAAEFTKRKNHIFIINALENYLKTNPNIKILFAGDGILIDKMKNIFDNENFEIKATIDNIDDYFIKEFN